MTHEDIIQPHTERIVALEADYKNIMQTIHSMDSKIERLAHDNNKRALEAEVSKRQEYEKIVDVINDRFDDLQQHLSEKYDDLKNDIQVYEKKSDESRSQMWARITDLEKYKHIKSGQLSTWALLLSIILALAAAYISTT